MTVQNYQEIMQAGQNYVRMEDLDFSKFREIFHIQSNFYLLVQSLPYCVPLSVIMAFLPDYLETEKGMSVG